MEAVCAPFSFEAAHGMLRCHGEFIAVPHAEGCTQWLLLVCRRAAYAVRLVLPFGLTLQRCCVILLCVRKVYYPELGVGSLVPIPSRHLARVRLKRLQCVQWLRFPHPSAGFCLSARLRASRPGRFFRFTLRFFGFGGFPSFGAVGGGYYGRPVMSPVASVGMPGPGSIYGSMPSVPSVFSQTPSRVIIPRARSPFCSLTPRVVLQRYKFGVDHASMTSVRLRKEGVPSAPLGV